MRISRAMFLALLLWQSACGGKSEQDCEKHIRNEIQPGLPLEIAEAKLRKCGFKTTLDPTKKILYGNKLVEGVPISERRQVLINLDSDNKVASVTVSTGLVGP
jgi:hypothetical protein